MKRRAFGALKTLRSGRIQASFVGPDGARHLAPITFARKEDAETYLAGVQTDIARGQWESPKDKEERERRERIEKVGRSPITFNEWADLWLKSLPGQGRTEKTVQTHRYRLTGLKEEFGEMDISSITEGDVQAWYDLVMADKGRGVARPTYMTLSACLNYAVKRKRLDQNPCQIPDGSKHVPVKDAERRQVATPAEVDAFASAMPDQWAIAVHLAAWCQVREGEMIGLRRRDVDLQDRMLHIRRQTQFYTGKPPADVAVKSEAGERSISIPQALIPALKKHLKNHVGKDPDSRLIHKPGFPSEPLHPNTLRGAWNRAREAVGMKWFVYHDLRHTGLTIYAQNGATLAELLHRGGHSDVEVALRYQHATRERDEALAGKMNTQIVITI